jgi:hypothetical protein
MIAHQSGRADRGLGLYRLDTGTVGSNPTQHMDIFHRYSVPCCPVESDILRQAEHPPKESNCRYILSVNVERRRFELSKNCRATGKKERKEGRGKAVPLHAMEALGGRGGIAPTHSRPRH